MFSRDSIEKKSLIAFEFIVDFLFSPFNDDAYDFSIVAFSLMIAMAYCFHSFPLHPCEGQKCVTFGEFLSVTLSVLIFAFVNGCIKGMMLSYLVKLIRMTGFIQGCFSVIGYIISSMRAYLEYLDY